MTKLRLGKMRTSISKPVSIVTEPSKKKTWITSKRTNSPIRRLFPKNKKYQEYGWRIYESFEKYTKIDIGGYSSINDVTNPFNVKYRNKMESFFLAETLKYFYLLFEDDFSENIDIDKLLETPIIMKHVIDLPEILYQ